MLKVKVRDGLAGKMVVSLHVSLSRQDCWVLSWSIDSLLLSVQAGLLGLLLEHCFSVSLCSRRIAGSSP